MSAHALRREYEELSTGRSHRTGVRVLRMRPLVQSRQPAAFHLPGAAGRCLVTSGIPACLGTDPKPKRTGDSTWAGGHAVDAHEPPAFVIGRVEVTGGEVGTSNRLLDRTASTR